MRTRRVLAVLTLVVAVIVGVPQAGSQPSADPNAGINDLIRGFLTENSPDYLPESVSGGGANTEEIRTAFGGVSDHDPELAAPVVVTDSVIALVNLTGTRGFVGFGDGLSGPILRVGDDTTPGATPDDLFVVDLDTGLEFPLADGSAVPPTGPTQTFTLDEFVDNLGGVEGVDYQVIRSMNTEEGITIDGPVVVHGVRVQGPLPMTPDCGGQIIELGSSFHLLGGREWPLNPLFPEDLAIGASDMIVGRCRPGVGWYIDALRNMGPSFGSLDSNESQSIGIVNANGALFFTPARYLPGVMGSRQWAFTTPDSGGYRADNTAHTVTVFPGLTPAQDWPTLVGDPFAMYPRIGVFPLTLDFSGDNDTSACGPNEWSDNFELHVEEGTGPAFPAKLYQFASGQFTTGTFTSDGSALSIVTSGGGTGFTESFNVAGGTGDYAYSPNDSLCPFTVTAMRGWDGLQAIDWGGFAPLADSDPVSDDASAPPDVDSGSDLGSDSGGDSSSSSDAGQVIDGSDGIGIAAPGSGASSSSKAPYVGLIFAGIGLAGGGYLYERRRGSFTTIQAGVDEPVSAQLSERDLQQYAQFGVADYSTDTGRQAAVLEEDKEASQLAATVHETALEEQRAAEAAARKADFESQLLDPPRRVGNMYLTDNPYLAFAFGFIEDFENGNARDRLYTFVETVPEAGEALVDNTVKSIETAYNGWGEIIDDPSKLEGLDEGIVATGEQLADLGGRYVAAASADDGGQEFARMTSHLTVNLEAMAISHKVMVSARTALVSRLGGAAPAATAEAAGASTQATTAAGRTSSAAGTAGRTGAGVPRTPPRGAPGPRQPAVRTPPPVDPSAPTVVNGYGPAVRGAPIRGGGTPIQAHPMGCGAAVMRGMLNDLGLRILPEMQILREGFMLGAWEGTGMSLNGAARILQRVLPAGYRVLTGTFRGVNDAAHRVGGWLAANPTGQVMVGLRWANKFRGGAGHFVRVEAVRNGWVILGDPQWGRGISIAIPLARFNELAEVVITVLP